MYVDNMVHHSV